MPIDASRPRPRPGLVHTFLLAARPRRRRIGLRPATLAGLALVWILASGCASPNVNPSSPRAKTGYVDFYTDSDMDLSWEVKLLQGKEHSKTLFFDFYPIEGSILRLAAPPGTHQFQVWFINRATEGPQSLRVEVQDGRVTPVHVTLKKVGKTSVNRKVYGFYGSTKGYGRGTRVITDVDEVYRIDLAAGTPEAYRPKQRMTYWSPPPG